ncbi:hypothetical protein JCM10213v2_005791 [Rhodosporidiobolus nylandii]
MQCGEGAAGPRDVFDGAEQEAGLEREVAEDGDATPCQQRASPTLQNLPPPFLRPDLERTRTFVSLSRVLSSPSPGSPLEQALPHPPTPTGVPGEWRAGGGTSRKSWQGETDEALLLPPPFLTEESARRSFDGLLGERQLRQQARLSAQHARLRSQGRAPPLPFPQNLLRGLSKLAKLLGPPDGSNERASYRQRERQGAIAEDDGDEEGGKVDETRLRRAKRAESGIRAYELGVEVGKKVKGRLERHRSHRGQAEDGTAPIFFPSPASVSTSEAAAPARHPRLRAATPSQLLGSPPSAPFAAPFSSSNIPSSPPFLSLDPLLPFAPPLTPLDVPPPRFPAPSAAPLPTISTPFSLDPLEDLDEGYFGLRRRGRRTSLGLGTPPGMEDGGEEKPVLAQPSPFAPGHTPAPVHPVLDALIWLLVGSPSPPPSPSTVADLPLALGGLLGLLVHVAGFLFFLAYHLLALFHASYFALKDAGVWVYWAGKNLSGRTEVSRAVGAYYLRCREEWESVCREEGERRLGVWEVARGVVELAILQQMTCARYLTDGPGKLVLLTSTPPSLAAPTPRLQPFRRRPSAVAQDRPAFTQRHSSYLWTADDGEEQDGEGLVVEKQDGGVLEGAVISHASTWQRSPAWPIPRDLQKTPRVPTPVTEEEEEEEPPPLDLDAAAPSRAFALSSTSPPLLPLPEHPSNAPLSVLLTTLKRHTRLSTASYGLHTYIVDAPTPLMTPSGKTLPQRVFAHLAGSDHRDVLHVALQKRYEEKMLNTGLGEEGLSYAPQFYLLRDDREGEVVCVIRGTQSLADVRTDLDGDFVDLPLPPPHPPSSGSSPPAYRIHRSILLTAQRLLSPDSSPPSPLLSKLRSILDAHPRYSLVFTGHSLGASLSSTLALLLGEYDEKRKAWFLSPASLGSNADEGDAFRRPLRAVCFAHPTTLNVPLAARCALPFGHSLALARRTSGEGEKQIPLVVNVSLGADAVCRVGLPQIRELRRAVGRAERLRARLSHEGVRGVLSVWRSWRKLRGREGEEAARERELLEAKAWEWRREIEDWDDEDREKDEDAAIPAGRAYHLDVLPAAVERERREELGADREAGGGEVGEEEEEEPIFGLYEVRNPKAFYRLPLLDANAVAAHMPKAYLDAMDALEL